MPVTIRIYFIEWKKITYRFQMRCTSLLNIISCILSVSWCRQSIMVLLKLNLCISTHKNDSASKTSRTKYLNEECIVQVLWFINWINGLLNYIIKLNLKPLWLFFHFLLTTFFLTWLPLFQCYPSGLGFYFRRNLYCFPQIYTWFFYFTYFYLNHCEVAHRLYIFHFAPSH